MRLQQFAAGRAIRRGVILILGEERALCLARRVTGELRRRGVGVARVPKHTDCTHVRIPRIHIESPGALGRYWVEMQGHGRAPGLENLEEEVVHPEERALLEQPYEAPWVDYPFGRYRNPVTTTQWAFADLARAEATGERGFYGRAFAAGNWLVGHQSDDGAWRVGFPFADLPVGWVSAMYQGQAISLLLRLNALSPDARFLESSCAAYEFMLRRVSDGGALGSYADGSPVLEEYPGSSRYPHVLNGSIFALLGIYDLWLLLGDPRILATWNDLSESLEAHIGEYDTGRWTTYALGPPIATPDYHCLHIAQCRVMDALRGDRVWGSTARRWEHYLARWSRCPPAPGPCVSVDSAPGAIED